MKLLKTTNYDLFKSIDSNRIIDRSHVNKLVKSFKQHNFQKINPLIVNEKYEIIDGQHTLEACKILGIPVYYIIMEGLTKEHIAVLNTNNKNWGPRDYIHYYVKEGNMNYIILSRFIKRYGVNPSVAGILLFRSHNVSLEEGGQGCSKSIKEGTFEVKHETRAHEIMKKAHDFKEYGDFFKSRNFLVAFVKIINTGEYNHKYFLNKFSYLSRSFVKCPDIKTYIKMMEDIYNHKSRSRVRFF